MIIKHHAPKLNDSTDWQKRFAFLPTLVSDGDDTEKTYYTVWFEYYLVRKVYRRGLTATKGGVMMRTRWVKEYKLYKE